jgi:LysM repeat protein
VRQGDTLGGIARRSGVTLQALMDANGLTDSRIQVGTTLRIPKTAHASGKSAAAKGPRTYIVRRGDTLQSIARRHRTTVQALLRANNRQDFRMQAGEALVIPAE